MNKQSVLASIAVAVFFVSTVAHAAQMNFGPGNEGDGSYVPRAERQVIAQAEEPKEPGFWDKEWERSGLSRAKVRNPFRNVGNFFKEQEERYLEREGQITEL